MPAVGGPWPASWVQTFQNWIETGCPAGEDPAPAVSPVAADALSAFLALSKALTGIDEFFRFNTLDPGAVTKQEEALATIYYNRLLKRPSNNDPNDNLAGVLKAWAANPDVAALAKQFSICKDIILIWYNTTTAWDAYGTPAFNQYKEGQVWKVSLIHPMGYAPENTAFYWQNNPSDNGEYSGYYYVNY